MDKRILEIKETLSGEYLKFDCAVVDRGQGWLVVLYVVPDEVELDGVKIPRGSRSFGYFWEDRPYNAYHFVGPEGNTLALYCNLSDGTRIGDAVVHWRDLVVDVLILPDGTGRILDTHELPGSLSENLVNAILDTANLLKASGHNLLTELETKTAEYL
ncbi:ribonuclease FAU-1 family protein [Porticoccus sp.]